MSKVQTQAEKLSSQFSSKKSSGLEYEELVKHLADKKFHGRKIDVPVDWIIPGENQRSKLEDIDALKRQILEIGLAQPIGIQLLDGQIVAVYGHRRLQAFKELSAENPTKFATISCIVQVYDNPEQGRVIAQAVENLGRSDLAPLDECIAINELKTTLSAKTGVLYTNEHLGEFLGGVHRKTIDLAVVIANWPTTIHDKIRSHSESFSISLLRSIAKKGLKDDDLKKVIDQHINASLESNKRVHKTMKEHEVEVRNLLKDKFDKKTVQWVVKQKVWELSAEQKKALAESLTINFSNLDPT